MRIHDQQKIWRFGDSQFFSYVAAETKEQAMSFYKEETECEDGPVFVSNTSSCNIIANPEAPKQQQYKISLWACLKSCLGPGTCPPVLRGYTRPTTCTVLKARWAVLVLIDIMALISISWMAVCEKLV